MRQPFGSPPPGGRAHGYGCGRQPLAERGTAGGACAVGPAVTRPARGYRLRPIWVGQRGICRGLLSAGHLLITATPRGGGRAGGGDGGSVRHRSRLGTPEQGGGLQGGAIIGGAFVVCANHLGAHPLGGGRTGMGAGGSP